MWLLNWKDISQIFFTSSVYTHVLKFLIIKNIFFLTFLRFQFGMEPGTNEVTLGMSRFLFYRFIRWIPCDKPLHCLKIETWHCIKPNVTFRWPNCDNSVIRTPQLQHISLTLPPISCDSKFLENLDTCITNTGGISRKKFENFEHWL